MPKIATPRRYHHLDRDDVGQKPLRGWPPGVRFEDVTEAELAFERLTDRAMPPAAAPAGAYGWAAGMCAMSRFAEPEIDGISG